MFQRLRRPESCYVLRKLLTQLRLSPSDWFLYLPCHWARNVIASSRPSLLNTWRYQGQNSHLLQLQGNFLVNICYRLNVCISPFPYKFICWSLIPKVLVLGGEGLWELIMRVESSWTELMPYIKKENLEPPHHFCCVKRSKSVSQSVMSDSLWPHGSLLGSSVHGILQERILEWVAVPFSMYYVRKQ